MRTAGVARSTHVLILAPAGRDAALTQAVLGHAGIASAVCANLDELCRALMTGAAHGVAAAIITEEGLIEGDVAGLARWIADQDPWSDLPFVVLLDRRTSSADGAEQFAFLRTAANITLLERPVHGATLVSAVKAALRARGRQYEVHDTLKALEESEQRYRTLADSLPQLVWTCRPDGTCDYLSRQWLDYTGLPESEQQDLSWPDLAIHPDDRERVSECWSAAIGGSGDYDLELRIRGASGDYRWFKTRGTPLRDAEGRIAKWFGTCTDISEIVVARETSARSRAELESLVTARTKSLAEANNLLMKEIAERERAEDALRQTQKLESLGQLTSGVAHDFNNLLTAVLGNIDLATRRIDDEATMRPLRGAIRAAERGAKLTTQLLAFSPVAGADRSEPDRAGADQSRHQRPRCHGGGRPADDPHRQCAGRCQTHRFAAGRLRDDRRGGHRHRDDRAGPGQGLRAVLHDQGGRQGKRPRPQHGARPRRPVGRQRLHRQPRRPWHHRWPLRSAGERRAGVRAPAAGVGHPHPGQGDGPGRRR